MGSVSAQAPTRTYEIQRFANGRWLLDSVGDDKKVAVAMANALFKSGRAPMGVQVMAVQRGGDGQFSEMRIYRLTPGEEQSAAVAQAKASTLPKSTTLPRPRLRVERPRDGAEAVRRPGAHAARGRSDFSLRDWRAWAAIGFVLAWCAVFYIWHQPQKPWAFDRPEAQTRVKEHVPLP